MVEDQTPGMAPWDETQDVRLQSALQAVPVPALLASRIKAAMQQHLSAQSEGQVELQVQPKGLPKELSEELPGLRSSGLLRRAILVMALAAGLAGFAFLANQWRQPTEQSTLIAQCNTLLESWEQGNPADFNREPVQLEIPGQVQSQLVPIAVMSRSDFGKSGTKFSGTLLRLNAGNGQGLVLIRLPNLSSVRGLTSRFTVLPTPSGGWSMAALSINSETYVLASVGTEQQLFSFIRQAAVT